MKSFPHMLAAAAVAAASAGFAQAPARTEIPNAAQPQLAVATDGRVWLVYGRIEGTAAPRAEHAVDHGQPAKAGHRPNAAKARPAGGLFAAYSDDGGVTFSPAVKVGAVPGLMLGMRRGPRIAAHGSRVTVTAVGDELIAIGSADSGKTWGAPVTINDVPKSAREGLQDLAAAPDGGLFATWLDIRNGKMELWGASSRDGRTWAKNEQVYRSSDQSICECCHPTALFDAEGNLAVMWRNSIEGSRDMWMTTRARGSAGFAPAKKIGEGTWKLKACPMDGGRIVALGGGNFGAVWQRAGEVFLSRPEGSEVRLGKGKQPVAVQTGDGRPLVMWQQDADLVVLRNLPGAGPVRYASDARFPSLVTLPGGRGTVLAYERGPAKGPTSVAVDRL